MTYFNLFIIATFCVLYCPTYPIVSAILCYQCADLSNQSNCRENYELLVNTSMGLTKEFFQNCSDSKSSWDRCMIERYYDETGKFALFHRGCHDGKNFSQELDDTRFHDLTPNNLTTCSMNSKKHFVCYQFCDTDFCNGPIAPEEQECNTTYDEDGYMINSTCGAPGFQWASQKSFVHLACNFFIALIAILLSRHFSE